MSSFTPRITTTNVEANDTWAPPRINPWLRLTSWGWNEPQPTIAGRERARRSRLASWIILGLFVADAALLPLGIGDTGSEAAVLILALGLVSATVLNHAGQVGFAGALIALLITAGAIGAVVSYPAGLTLDALPAFDLMAVSVVVAASLLPRRAAFIVAAINIALITTDF